MPDSVSEAGPNVDQRIDGAQSQIQALAQRLESLFATLREPAPTPPWRLLDAEAPGTDDASGAELTELRAEVERLRDELSQRNREAGTLSAKLELAEKRAHDAEEVNEQLSERLEETRDHAEHALTELKTARANLDKVRGEQERSAAEAEVLRAELDRRNSESGPIPLGGVDPSVFQAVEDELALVKRELEETRHAHAQALEQMRANLPDPEVTENSVVRAMRAEDGLRQMQEHLQRQLLEHEEVRRQRDEFRRGNEQLRSELRLAQQKRDHYKSQVKNSGNVDANVSKLRASVAKRDKQIEELQAELRAKQREVETHEKREAHLRSALNRRKTR